MKHCTNDQCPDLLRDGFRAEWRQGVDPCPTCGQTLADGPAPPRATETRWVDHVCIATFPQPTTAHLARAQLELAGISAIIRDEHLAGSQLYTQVIGGTRLCVTQEHAQEAARILGLDDPSELAD